MRVYRSLGRIWGLGLAKILFLSVLSILIIQTPATVSALASSPSFDTTYKIDSDTSSYIDGALVAHGTSWGESYLAGSVDGTARLVSPGGIRYISSSGDGSSFLAKYDGSGNVEWEYITQPDTDSYSYPTAVTVDSAGSVIVTGAWTGTVTFDGVGGSDTRTNNHTTSSGVRDTYVTKYDQFGQYLWTVTTDSPGGDRWVTSTSMVSDSNNAVFIGGIFVGPIKFDGPGGTHSLDAGNNANGFLMKLDSNGVFQFVYAPDNSDPTDGNPGLSTSVYVNDIALDSNENVYISGQYSSSVTFGAGDTFQTNGSLPFVTKLGNDGLYKRTTVFSSVGDAEPQATSYQMAISSDDHIYLTGVASAGSFLVDGSHSVSIDSYSTVLYKLKNNGDLSWWRNIGATVNEDTSYVSPSGLVLDQNDNAYISGTYGGEDAIRFDPNCSNILFDAPPQSSSYFLSGYSAAGNYMSTSIPGYPDDTGFSIGTSLALNADVGTVFLGGIFQGNIMLDGPDGHIDRSPFYSGGSSLFVNIYSLTIGQDEPICVDPVDDPETGNQGGSGGGEASGTVPPAPTLTRLTLDPSAGQPNSSLNVEPASSASTPDPTPSTDSNLIPSNLAREQASADQSDIQGRNYQWLWLLGLALPALAGLALFKRAGVKRNPQ